MFRGGYAGVAYTNDIINISNKNYSYESLDENNIPIIMDECINNANQYISSLNKLYSKDKKIIKYNELFMKLKNEINNNFKNNLIDLENKSIQYISFIKTICFDVYYFMRNLTMNDYIFFLNNYKNEEEEILKLLNKILNLKYIDRFSNIIDKNITIIGGNGSGKSSFVSFLKSSYFDSMIIVPAQKLLIFDRSISGIIDTREDDIKSVQNENSIEAQRNSNVYLTNSYSATIFSKMIIAVANSTIKQLNYNYENHTLNPTILDKINEICIKFLHVKFKLNPDIYTIDAIDEKGNVYNINSMSDGEKMIFFYIANVLYAKDNSYIVIDEPETHLNPAVYKQLWNKLEDLRNDCQFIYVSHDIEFVRSRRNNVIFWMKKFDYPIIWDIIELEKNSVIPIDLMIEIYGSKNKILFCEGTKDSDDINIYSSLFENEFTVIPSGSCEDVKKFTKAFNEQKNIHNNEAIGIIDYDFRTEKQINDLKKKKIIVTKYNEIEMILFDEKVIEKLLENYKDKKEDIINKFKNKLFEHIKLRKEKIIYELIRNSLNCKFSNKTINSNKIEKIDDELNTFIEEIKSENSYNKYEKIINDYLDNKDYNSIIRICNLKNEVISLADNLLCKNFKLQASNLIKYELKDYIKKKYFDLNDINT